MSTATNNEPRNYAESLVILVHRLVLVQFQEFVSLAMLEGKVRGT